MVLQAESLGWDTLGGSAGLRWAWLIAAVLTRVCVQLVGQLGLPGLFWLQVAYLRQLGLSAPGFLSPSYLTYCCSCGSIQVLRGRAESYKAT